MPKATCCHCGHLKWWDGARQTALVGVRWTISLTRHYGFNDRIILNTFNSILDISCVLLKKDVGVLPIFLIDI